jgi:NTP pyrophosphatase (non-canonical NTP hydrolase)
MDLYETLCRLVREVEEDMKKAAGGNKAAGTRVRKTMQEVKECAQAVRQDILNMRDSSEGDGKGD